MPPRRRIVLFAALAAAFVLRASGASAVPSKLGQRLRAHRAAGPHGAKLPAASRARGSGRPVFVRVAPGTSVQALRAAHPAVAFGSQLGGIVTAFAGDAALDAL